MRTNADTKTTFKILNSLQQKCERKLPKLESDQAVCEAFSTFFISKIDKIMVNIHETVKSEAISKPSTPLPSKSTPILDHFQPTDETEIKKIIMTGPSKSCSLDALPTSLLKKSIDVHLPILCKIINWSLRTGIFPAALKTTDVTPIIKKASLDQNTLKNYRPVSNLAFTGKLMEKVVLKRVNEHMSKHKLGEPLQSAYRPRHSTETALMSVQHDIVKELDQGKGVAMVLLDLSAAFDTINPQGVTDTLQQHIGVNGTPLTWFKDYLANRRQRVRIGSTVSAPMTLTRGVPQGSVLGPVLFTTYTIPLAAICAKYNVKYHIYADDTQLYVVFDPSIPGDCERALCRLKNCIKEIRAWMLTHELKLNDDKTEYIIYQSRHHQQKHGAPELILGEFSFQPSCSVRNLGAFFDAEMTRKRHVSEVCRSSYYFIRQIGRIRTLLTRDACNDAVRSAILSRLDYSNALLGGLRKSDLDRLQRVQNRAARLVSLTKIRESITPVLCDLHWLPVQSRIEFKLCTYMYKAIHQISPAYISSEVSFYRPQRALRSSNAGPLLNITVGCRNIADFDFAVKGPQLWNVLPVDIRDAPSVMTFKKKLKTFLFRKHFFCSGSA